MATARAERAKTSDENGSHSGRLLLRMPPELHAELAREAEKDGSSLNSYITRILSGGAGRDDSPQQTPASSSRLLRYAIIADLVLVAVAAVVAVALLIAAWP